MSNWRCDTLLIVELLLFVLLSALIYYVCYKEVKGNKMNPLPKFENNDKHIENVPIKKTRDITYSTNIL